jgi:ferric-dicitrate binding protein FerR (iron transport regulator)
MPDMESNILWELIGKKIAGEASPEELQHLQALLERYPEALYTLETLDTYWRSGEERLEHERREAALERHMDRMRDLQPEMGSTASLLPWWRRRVLGYTAAAAAVTGIIVMTFFRHTRTQSTGLTDQAKPTLTLTATKGNRNHFTLPDGSKVWLNAGTTLTYPVSFDKDNIREVTLTGEAFFKVTHDSRHPFWIHTSRMDIHDLGTSFNVKAYPKDKTFETTLVEGSLEVRLKDAKDMKVLSHPNEKITVYATGEAAGMQGADRIRGKISTRRRDSADFRTSMAIPNPNDSMLAETAWLKNVLVFNNESFADLAVRMERWYDVSINFKDTKQGKFRFTGAFANETVKQALFELQQIRPFHYTIEGKNILIRE